MKNKIYIIINGHKGINVHSDWDECRKEVRGFSNAIYKSFEDKNEAIIYMKAKLKTVHGFNADKVDTYIEKFFGQPNKNNAPFTVDEDKIVRLYVYAASLPDNPNKPGGYKGMIEWNGIKKYFEKYELDTHNVRMLLEGVIEGIGYLNEPCQIEIYTNAPFGFQKMKNLPKYATHPNITLLTNLSKMIQENNHQVIQTIYQKSSIPHALRTLDLHSYPK